MHIAVTGGIGSIGRTTVARLLAHGHRVRILDRVPASEVDAKVLAEIRGAEYRQVDITDFASLRGILDGMDGVVHLAALASPAMGPEHLVYDVNTRGTFNIYRTAADAGITRVVNASSINALGYNYGVKAFPIRYFPIDEAHPDFTTDPYSFSKRVVEETADYFWRREGVSGVSLRFPGVYRAEGWHAERRAAFRQQRQEALAAFEALTEAERKARLKVAIERSEVFRETRLKEQPFEEQRKHWEKLRSQGPPPPEMMLCWGRTDFWASINVLDAAQAIEKGLLADYEGSHVLFVNDSHNSTGVESRKLVEYCFPEVTEWKREVQGTESLVSIERARALIGFEPEHSIADAM
jgi:nucleoside-diphosphate-sugar epimerase